MSGSPHSFGAKAKAGTAILAVAVFTVGCVAIPIGGLKHYSAGSRKNIPHEKLDQSLVQGMTKFEDVLLLWGEPDGISKDERHIQYRWSYDKFYVLSTGAGGGPVAKYYDLLLDFDEHGILTHYETKAKWLPTTGSFTDTRE